MTLTTDELRQIVETDHVQCGDAAAMARELLANREAQPVQVTDGMALDFHHALTDGSIGSDELEEIKVGLRAALCNVTATPAPAKANPVAWEMRYWNSGYNMWHDWERITAEQHAEMSMQYAADNDYEFRILAELK
ncbi:hypothetical protein [Serratia bockelmannii]|uniref:hypothetical protein n=1 Tax=Serratia bockelmannii TaxID=2703793 RepID=UPI00313DB8D0